MSTFPRGETKPEMALRRALHQLGYRYRVHVPVPGAARRKIDVAFTRARVAVFIDGCFWHGCPQHGRIPATNVAWWEWKLAGNQERDADTTHRLTEEGWTVVRVWEHEDVTAMVTAVQSALELAAQRPNS
jgi:DNA mismatch endonuclease (patch repair protein)